MSSVIRSFALTSYASELFPFLPNGRVFGVVSSGCRRPVKGGGGNRTYSPMGRCVVFRTTGKRFPVCRFSTRPRFFLCVVFRTTGNEIAFPQQNAKPRPNRVRRIAGVGALDPSGVVKRFDRTADDPLGQPAHFPKSPACHAEPPPSGREIEQRRMNRRRVAIGREQFRK